MATNNGLYVVVCSGFHQSLGPFGSAEYALSVAKQLNKSSKCVFIPVPMNLPEGTVAVETKSPEDITKYIKSLETHSKKKEKEDDADYRPGIYL